MPEDFNIRQKNEAQYSDAPVITNELELFLQEIDVLFSTDEFEVLGNEGLGMSLEKFLGKWGLGNNQIKSFVIKKIQENCYMNEVFNWSVDVAFQQGQISDIMLLDVVIKDQSNTKILKKLSFIYR